MSAPKAAVGFVGSPACGCRPPPGRTRVGVGPGTVVKEVLRGVPPLLCLVGNRCRRLRGQPRTLPNPFQKLLLLTGTHGQLELRGQLVRCGQLNIAHNVASRTVSCFFVVYIRDADSLDLYSTV